MQILSFASSGGHHVTRFGSDFVLSPLMGSQDVARTVCMHLHPGGLVGQHEAATQQLFCVVAGRGWVSGSDGARVPIGPMQAAKWDAGEVHAAGSDEGLVAFVIEGEFTPEAPPAR